jgi:hypothetical protein
LRCCAEPLHSSRAEKANDAMAEHVQDLDLEDPDDQEDPNQQDEQPLVLTRDDMDALRFEMEQEIRKELGAPPKWDLPKFKIEFHRRQLALLEQANHAPRCEHVFTDGRSCGAPRVRKGKLCYAHTLMEEKRPRRWNLPPLEDANAVTLWLMDISRGLLDGTISERTAGLMFYGLQLAMINARHTTFKETNHAEMVRKAPRDRRNRASSPTSEEKALPQRSQRSAEEDQKTAILTTETRRHGEPPDLTAKGAKENQEPEPQRSQRSEEEDQKPVSLTAEARRHGEPPDLTAKDAKENQEPEPQRAQRSAKEDQKPVSLTAETRRHGEPPDLTAKGAKEDQEPEPQRSQRSAEEEPSGDFTAEIAEIAAEESQEKGTALRTKDRLEPQNAEGTPGLTGAKSIFSGVEAGEGEVLRQAQGRAVRTDQIEAGVG